ncbi:calcium-dependent cysteine-type endopeptidase [Aureococcus anophagefferens]|nr:calcium-dependent cysteine-type endopeptidase [Aureococcus anophagefferens]
MASPSLAKRRSSLWARYEAACRDAALLEKRAAPIPSGLSSLRPPAWEAGDLEQLESASALDAWLEARRGELEAYAARLAASQHDRAGDAAPAAEPEAVAAACAAHRVGGGELRALRSHFGAYDPERRGAVDAADVAPSSATWAATTTTPRSADLGGSRNLAADAPPGAVVAAPFALVRLAGAAVEAPGEPWRLRCALAYRDASAEAPAAAAFEADGASSTARSRRRPSPSPATPRTRSGPRPSPGGAASADTARPRRAALPGPRPGDARGGLLEDRWLCGAMNALAERPDAVEACFPALDGPHEVACRLFLRGTARTVAVDDLAPCHAGAGGGVLFTACGDRDKAWAQLLEKAAAKAFGSYAALRRGWAYEGLLALTGAPCEAVRFGDARVRRDLESGDLWAKLRFWLDSGSLVTASTPDDDDGDARADTVYTLLRAADVLGGADGHERRQALLLRDAGGVGPPDGVVDEAPRDGGDRAQGAGHVLDGLARGRGDLRAPQRVPPAPERRRRLAHGVLDASLAEGEPAAYADLVLSGGAPADCYVAAHQADERGDGADAYVDLALVVLRRRDGGGYDLVDAVFPSLERQVATPRLLLGPGAYVVIAWSSGARLRGGRAADVSIVVHAATDAPLALTLGDASPYPEHGFTIHALTAGGNGVSFAVENLGEKPLDFTMDCGNARNAASHRGSLQHTAAVAPGALALLHHLSPAGPGLWSWSYECEWHEAGAAPAPREHDARDGGPFRPTLAY